jgi:hypothetical protein
MRSRLTRLLTLLSLLVAPLAVASSTQTAQAGPGIYAERWCAAPNPAPCLVSVKRNGVSLTVSDPNFAVQSTGKLSTGDFDYFGFLVAQIGATPLSTGDTWEFEFDTGTLDPNYMEGFAGVPDMDRIVDPEADGTYHVRYTAKPIVYTYGCDTASPVWPWPCTAAATSEEVKLSVEVQDRNDEFARFFSAQSPQGVNGIFLETALDGSRYLSSEMVNSHFRADGTTVFQGEVRFRIPYAMLHDSFGVPDPSTMDATSLSGTVNGSTTAASFHVWHDPDGGGMFVDITGLTFSKKVIKVKRGVITPRRPTNLVATRIDSHTGKVAFTLAKARGAKPTGYKIRCVSGGGHVVTNTKTTPTSPIRIGGLRTGVGYDCKVRATSKAGPGTWSTVVRMRARP